MSPVSPVLAEKFARGKITAAEFNMLLARFASINKLTPHNCTTQHDAARRAQCKPTPTSTTMTTEPQRLSLIVQSQTTTSNHT
jgi:hypothetical protein